MTIEELIEHSFNNTYNVFRVLIQTEKDFEERHQSKLEKLDLAIFNADLQLTQAFAEVSMAYDRYPDERRDIYDTLIRILDEVDEIISKPDVKLAEQRQNVANKLRNKIMEQFQEYNKGKLIKLNANQNQIYQILHHLKSITLKGRSKSIIDYPYIQLAQFLIDHVEGFQGKNALQLSKEIMKVPKRGKLREDIVIKTE